MTYWFERKLTVAFGASVQPTNGSIAPVQSPEVVPVVPLTGRLLKVWFPAAASTVSEAERTVTLSNEASVFDNVIVHSLMLSPAVDEQIPSPVHELGSAQSALVPHRFFGETQLLKMLTPWPWASATAGKKAPIPRSKVPNPTQRTTVALARSRDDISFLRNLWEFLDFRGAYPLMT